MLYTAWRVRAAHPSTARGRICDQDHDGVPRVQEEGTRQEGQGENIADTLSRCRKLSAAGVDVDATSNPQGSGNSVLGEAVHEAPGGLA